MYSEWETWACSSALCAGWSWHVQRAEGADELWHLAEHASDAGFLIAGAQPCCPRCGGDLSAVITLPERVGSRLSARR